MLEANGRYFYGEGYQQWIEIEQWEYERILENPRLYYFSTALKKHYEWIHARRTGNPLTFAKACGDPGFRK